MLDVTSNDKSVSWQSQLAAEFAPLLQGGSKFWFECGKGWASLLKTMLADIQAFEQTTKRRKANEDTVTAAVGDAKPYYPIRFGQIKEKFGGLRAYHDGGNDPEIERIIDLAEQTADKTCELCGRPGSIESKSGWLVTTCEPCFQTKK